MYPMCHPVPVRVATFNILHGVPLRDVQVGDTGGPGRRRRGIRGRHEADEADPSGAGPVVGPASGDEQLDQAAVDALRDGDLAVDVEPEEGIDPADVRVGGADPTRRVQWAPTVSDPA